MFSFLNNARFALQGSSLGQRVKLDAGDVSDGTHQMPWNLHLLLHQVASTLNDCATLSSMRVIRHFITMLTM